MRTIAIRSHSISIKRAHYTRGNGADLCAALYPYINVAWVLLCALCGCHSGTDCTPTCRRRYDEHEIRRNMYVCVYSVCRIMRLILAQVWSECAGARLFVCHAILLSIWLYCVQSVPRVVHTALHVIKSVIVAHSSNIAKIVCSYVRS